MTVFKCKMCGGTLEIQENQSTAVCEYCGTKQTLPKLDNDKRTNLFDRANHFRRNNEFDKAMGIYEQILNEDGSDAEVYWSLVLCHYGIEYVEDPSTRKRVPTVNRAQFTSVFDDDNYKSALRYADESQKAIYIEEANTINEIQKGILAISQKEEPFDVFICYKETDNNGRRTQDSVLANDLYHQLTTEGFKVFFSRITLEDKLGVAYEPYIFAALNSAKVMVVIGTRAEYFQAVWVRNEWSRYLALVRQAGGKKILIPAYRDMDPYDLPEEFSHLQAQDMSKLGFMQDLIRGIKKLSNISAKSSKLADAEVDTAKISNIVPLLKRVYIYLEDGEWKLADEYCEKILDIDPENGEAYLGKLLAEYKCRTRDELRDCVESFEDNGLYQKVLRFGSKELKEEMQCYLISKQERLEKKLTEEIYRNGISRMRSALNETTFKMAADIFDKIPGYKDSDEKRRECLRKAEEIKECARKDKIYSAGVAEQNRELSIFAPDGTMVLVQSRQRKIEWFQKALEIYLTIPGWRDVDERIEICKKRIEELQLEEEESQKKQEKQKKYRRVRRVIVTLLMCIAALYGIARYQYESASKLMKQGNYEKAYSILKELEEFGFMDSKEKAAECKKQISREQ